MRMRNETGAINALLLPLILAVCLLIGTAVFGVWAFGGRQDYKDNVDQKVAAAVTEAKQAESKRKDAIFAEESKNPLKTYTGPSAYGSVIINYPKTWSGYVADTSGADPFVDGYFAPGVVPDIQAEGSNFALRVQVVGSTYSEALQEFDSKVKEGTVTVQPYALPKVPSVVGARITGELDENKQGHMIILPLRNTTLKIWTESNDFKADLDSIILPNASFSP